MLTLNEVPQTLEMLLQKVQAMEALLLKLTNSHAPASKANQWFDIDQLCHYLPDKPRKPTVYAMVSNKRIPYHKTGKKLRFLKSEIDKWLLEGRRQTVAETNAEAENKAVIYLRSVKNKK